MREIIKSAFAQLAGNKLRTFLTMLGMLIGVGSVIIILSLGEGMKGFIGDQFEGVGQGTIQVQAVIQKEDTLLTDDDVEMLEDLIIVAVNDALKKMEEDSNAKMGRFTAGMGGGFPF